MTRNRTRNVTLREIINANTAAGWHFFDAESMRFFDSKTHGGGWEGPFGCYLVTSERFRGLGMCADGERKWTVRVFDRETGNVDTAGDHKRGFQRYSSLSDAENAAHLCALRGPEAVYDAEDRLAEENDGLAGGAA